MTRLNEFSMGFLSFKQYRAIEPPSAFELQRAYDAFIKQGMTRDIAIKNVERDYHVVELKVNANGKITLFGYHLPEDKTVTVEIDPVC